MALAPLPVAALRISAPVVELLAGVGIERVGQLERLPRASLAARFGADLVQRLNEALGLAAEVIVPHRAAPLVEAGGSFEPPLERQAMLHAALARLTADVAGRLKALGRGAVSLECRLYRLAKAPLAVTVEMCRPSLSASHLLELLWARLENLELGGALCGVRLAVAQSALLEHRQQELFADRAASEEPRCLAALVDRLSNRLGRQAVLGARLVADAQAELAFQYRPALEGCLLASRGRELPATRRNPANAPRGSEKKAAAQAGLAAAACPGTRPLWLWREAVPLRVIPLLPDGPPRCLYWRGQKHRIRRSWGPERIETGWWRQCPVRRDYYRVENERGEWFWVFRELDSGQWFWHGAFG